MSHLRSDPPGNEPRPRVNAEGANLVPPLRLTAGPGAHDDADALDELNGPVEPTDDTPTIISRNPPRAGSSSGAAQPNGGDAFTTSAMNGLRGRRLAHFELIEAIGVGGMAAVLRARDTQLDRFVALKILPPEMAADPENVRRFHQEARSAAKLDHENIARVFFCGEDQRLHFIAFEFVEGDNLRTILERRGRLPVGEALHYMVQIAAGLAHAGRRHVVHRDIKPSNIIITPNGRAKLVDMGLARSMGPQTDNDLTQSGVTLGTFDYISPEQALEPRDADVRSDIYSLGCTFYHTLTGRPPVPEGTAAKKLHHHQHVKPADPRLYAPDLPIDVAVILDRMMAKSAKDRYQSPEQLVHHLLLVARKLGASPDVPEGVLSVEADLPNVPAGRPLLLAGLAAVAVVGLILLLGQSSTPTPRPTPPLAAKRDTKDKAPALGKSGPAPVAPPERAPVPPAAPGAIVAVYHPPEQPTAAHLRDWLKQHRDADRLEIELAGKLDLTAIPASPEGEGIDKGLVIAARQVVIRGDRTNPPTLRFTYDGEVAAGPRVALTVRSLETSIEGVRFVVDQNFGDAEMVGLLLQGGHKHRVERCELIQEQATRKSKRLASLVVSGLGEARRPELVLSQCCFVGYGNPEAPGEEGQRSLAGGQDAVVRRGQVRLTAENCTFGPHAATFRVEGGDERVTVNSCSVLAARRSAVFDVPAGGQATLSVMGSLFSRWGETGAADAQDVGTAVLVRQEENGPEVAYSGRNNRYHNFDGYWTVGDGEKANWREFQKKASDDSRVLVSHPWQAASPAQLKFLDDRQFVSAFQANAALPDLRRTDAGTEWLVGVQGKSYVPTLRPALDEKARRYLVVERGPGDSANHLYPTLIEAALAARPGDVILLRHDGTLKVDSVVLNKSEMSNLTVRPYRRSRPILTLGTTAETDAALFRLHDGKLRLEGLTFQLRPGREGLKSLAVVALLGDGDCLLKDCVVTLDRGAYETPLALAVLNEIKGMKMDMPPARTREQGPLLKVENCFVRGDGDFLWARIGRHAELRVENTLAALSGSFYAADVLADALAVPEGKWLDLSLKNVTTYLGGNLLRLSAGKDLKGLMPVKCAPANCLFLPAAAGRTLIYLDGLDSEEKALGEKLRWVGGANAYGTFATAVEPQPSSEEMAMMRPMSMEKWKRFANEEMSGQFNVRPEAKPATPDGSFVGIVPSDLVLPKDLTLPKDGPRTGANLVHIGRLLRRTGDGR